MNLSILYMLLVMTFQVDFYWGWLIFFVLAPEALKMLHKEVKKMDAAKEKEKEEHPEWHKDTEKGEV